MEEELELTDTLKEGLEILAEMGIDTNPLMRPLKEAKRLEARKEEIRMAIKKNAHSWKYLNKHEQDAFIYSFSGKC